MNIPSVTISGSAKGYASFRLAAALMVASGFASSIFAAGVTWSGATDTNFETGTNWGGTAPANDLTTDSGMFTGSPTTNQPALTANRSIGGLQFGSTGGWALSGGFNLTLGNILTVGSTSGVAIDASALASGTDTISGGTVSLGTSTQAWLVGTGGTLNVSSTVKAGSFSYINFGDASNAGTLVLGGTLDNSYLGLTITNGLVQLNKTSTSGVHAVGGTTTINGGTLQLTGSGGDQIWDSAGVTVNGGSFDLNGQSEAINQLQAGSAGGTVTNASGSASTLTVRGGGTYAGAFTGNLSAVVGGGGTGGSTFSGSVNNAGTITNNGTGSAAFTLSGTVGSNVTGVIQNSTTSMTVLTGNNSSFAGGVTIKAGTLQAVISGSLNNPLGSGTITIGDSANTGAAATLNFNNGSLSAATANAITTTGTGLATINLANYNETLSGGITMDSDLALTTTNTNNSTLTESGAISGTGNLTLKVGGTNAGSTIVLSGSSINNAGTITNSGTGPGPVTISGAIGTSVMGVIQNSATSQLTLSGNNTFTTGLTIKAGTVNGKNNGFGGATGIGTITLGDVANTGAAATLNWNQGNTTNGSAINVVGTGTRTISTTSFSPTYTGAVTLNSTDLNLVTNNTGGSNLTFTGGITGAGNLIIQSNAALTTAVNSKVLLTTGTINNVGTITNSGTGSISGTAVAGAIDTTISANIGSNVTQVIQNSANSNLILSGTNTYGLTVVQAGKASTSGSGTFGAGNVTVFNGAILVLGNSASIGNTATLSFGNTATINLNGQTETLAELVDTDTSTSYTVVGTYTAAQLNAQFGGISAFTGSGTITIVSAIPEPSTYTAIFGALAVGGAFLKRRRAIRQSPLN